MNTVSNQIAQYLQYCEHHKKLSEKTLKAYKIDFKQFEMFLAEKGVENHLGDIDKEVIYEYVTRLSSRYAVKSAKRKVACIKAFFNYMEFEDAISLSPFRKMKIMLREPFRIPKTLSLDEVSAVLSRVYEQGVSQQTAYQQKNRVRNIAIMELLFSTGMRVGELCNLAVEDIRICDSCIKVLGKGSRERIIYLNVETVRALKQYQVLFSAELRYADSYFINRLGRRLSEQSVRTVVKNYGYSLGDKKITPHMFRHSFATLMLEEGVDIKYIQEFLGHSSITTTQIYTHVNRTKQMSIVETMHPRSKVHLNSR